MNAAVSDSIKQKEIWLSLDLTGPHGSIAIHSWSETKNELALLSNRMVGNSMNHSELCFVELNALLKECSLNIEDVDRYITPIGPGSFTGLRIAMCVIKALAYCLNKPIETMNGSEARYLAYLQKSSIYKPVQVLTYATNSKAIIASFSPEFKEETIEWQRPSLTLSSHLLLDDRIPEALVNPSTYERTPLRASMLAETLFRAKSRKTYSSAEEKMALLPVYYGDATLKTTQPLFSFPSKPNC